MAWQGQSAWQGRSLWFDRSVSEALTAAFAIAGKPAPKLVVGANPDGSGTWSYDANEGKFYVPILPSSTMDDEQEHLFRAAIAHEVAGKEVATLHHDTIASRLYNIPASEYPGVKEGKRDHNTAYQQATSIAHGLTSAMVDAAVVERWPGMGRSLRRATEAMVTSAVKRVTKSRKHNEKATGDQRHPSHCEQFKYSDLALLAGFAAQGGKIRDLLRNVQYDVTVPDDFKQMAEQMASAADAEGLPSSADDVVPTAMRWLRHFEEPPAPPPQPEPQEGEGKDGKGKGQPDQGEGNGGGKGNPYDAATAAHDADHASGRSSGKQAGDELAAQLAEAGTGRDTTPYSGETKSFPFEESKKHLTRSGYTIAHLSKQSRNGYDRTPEQAQAEIDAFMLHYDRDVGVLGQALRQALRGPTIARQARHQVGRFNPRNAARYLAGNRDVFDRVTYQPGDKVAVSILIDMSGSMSSATEDREQFIGRVAVRAACVLNEALLRMGVPTRMCGYTTGHNLAAAIYELSTPKTTRLEFVKRRQFCADRVMALGGTPTLPAMQHELDLLMKRDESQRFLFVITDGDDGNPPSEHLAVIASAKARGVTTILLAIGGSTSMWNRYKAHLKDVAIVLPVAVEQMGPTMARALVKELLRARMMSRR